MAKQQKYPGNKVHNPNEDEDESDDDLGDEKHMVFKEVFYGFDLCFESELKQLEEAVFRIVKLTPVVKREVLDDGKSKVRALMNDLETIWMRVDKKQQRSREKRKGINHNENTIGNSTEIKRKAMRKRKSDGDLFEVREKIESLEESSLSEAETSQEYDEKLEEGMDPVKQLTKVVSDLTIEVGPRVGESEGGLVRIPTTPVLKSDTAQQHKDDGVIPLLLNIKKR